MVLFYVHYANTDTPRPRARAQITFFHGYLAFCVIAVSQQFVSRRITLWEKNVNDFEPTTNVNAFIIAAEHPLRVVSDGPHYKRIFEQKVFLFAPRLILNVAL